MYITPSSIQWLFQQWQPGVDFVNSPLLTLLIHHCLTIINCNLFYQFTIMEGKVQPVRIGTNSGPEDQGPGTWGSALFGSLYTFQLVLGTSAGSLV